MTNTRLYTNKAMAIGAVIDALDCDLSDLADIYVLTENRLRDKGVIDNPIIWVDDDGIPLDDDDYEPPSDLHVFDGVCVKDLD